MQARSRCQRWFKHAAPLVTPIRVHCRHCYDGVEPGAFFFVPDFRQLAVFFFTRHPCFFFVWDFFQPCFFDIPGLDSAAKEAVAPEKNIRPVRRAMITMQVLGMIFQSR
jgi:hypothetical protein